MLIRISALFWFGCLDDSRFKDKVESDRFIPTQGYNTNEASSVA
ncbi:MULTISPECIES: hypothetical protein [Cyanophyceae]|nr:hypothetical protein [Trichocoleus sp. FACHB-832]